MNKVRWGLLSTARINRALIPAIRESARGELVAVASRDQVRAETYATEWQIPRAFGSYEAMLEGDEIDAVYISLPNHLHVEWVVRALEVGKHVLCEKPLALSVEEVDRMARAADASGRVLAEAFMYLHHPQTALLSKWVQEGRLGELQLVRASFSFTFGRSGNYRWNPEMGGGALWDVGVYPISLAQWVIGGPPQHVLGHATWGDSGIDLTVSGQMHYDSGITAHLFCSFNSPWVTQAELIGSDGRLLLTRPFNNITPQDAQFIFFPQGAEDSPESIPVPDYSLYLGEVEDMHRAILDGTSPLISIEQSRNHVRTVQALLESAREGRVVSVA